MRIALWFACLVASLGVLAACGGSGDAEPPPTPTREDTAATSDVELDPAPDLPGEYVNLPEIYADERGLAHYGQSGDDGPSTAPHVRTAVDYEADGNTNPPVGGPHWGSSGCSDVPADSPPFCGPAPWGIYREAWPPETLVHNLEHGGAVVLYNTADQAVIRALEAQIVDAFGEHGQIVLAPYPDMEAETIALTTWARIDKFPVSEYSDERVSAYLDVHICRFNPEDLPSC